MNDKKMFVLRTFDKSRIGVYNCTFNMRSLFIYKCNTTCEGYMIRKAIWSSLMEHEIADELKKNIRREYFKGIFKKV